ncbi:hypothetical protein MMC10_003332 [Thelotrema lepadinum]|nr:hypothetical protein [Thelotrema lepadinum]
MALNSKYRYTALKDDSIRMKRESPYCGIYTKILLLTLCFLAGGAGYVSLRGLTKYKHASSGELQLNSGPHTFRYDRSFSEAPSNRTNTAWRQIFPNEGGFFIHETIAPTRSTFSVFHQLHCLDNIRRSYWVNHDAAVLGEQLKDEDVHVDIQPSHVRHCIDLLRQSLMCTADTTLEVVDEKTNGVHGFRTEHQCRDWEQLIEWANEQQAKQHVEQIV